MMPNWDAKALPRIANDVVATLAEQDLSGDSRLRDLAVSVVRQWHTYDGHALLHFAGKSLLYG